VLRYLGRYTHRIAISNHRLLAFDGQRVTFRWRDYAHGLSSAISTCNSGCLVHEEGTWLSACPPVN
jgi:hypothetical protein